MENLNESPKSIENKCRTCSKGLDPNQSWMIILSVFILITSVYGIIELFKDIFGFFK